MALKPLAAVLAASLLTATAAAAGDQAEGRQADVVYIVLFLKDGAVLSAPTVAGQYGREVRVEVANLMRAELSAERPDADSQSLTTAKLAVFKDGVWQPPKIMSMKTTLTMTPSFEYSVEGTPYRFVVMPRKLVPAADQGHP